MPDRRRYRSIDDASVVVGVVAVLVAVYFLVGIWGLVGLIGLVLVIRGARR